MTHQEETPIPCSSPPLPLQNSHEKGGGGEEEEEEEGSGDMDIIKPLGRGAFGTVFLLLHRLPASMEPLAMKLVSSPDHNADSGNGDGDGDDEISRRARREGDILSAMLPAPHPFLPCLLGRYHASAHHVLVMDFCSGGSLHSLLHKQPDRTFSLPSLKFYAVEILLALDHLHKLGIVYRDLKPENILIQSTGHIMLIDFDLSARITPRSIGVQIATEEEEEEEEEKEEEEEEEEKEKEKEGMKLRRRNYSSFPSCLSPFRPLEDVKKEIKKEGRPWKRNRVAPFRLQSSERLYTQVGTEEYVAPEILRGIGHDFVVDWWCFGILLYEMFYGKTPFKGYDRQGTFSNILTKDVHFPDGCNKQNSQLQDLIKKLLVKNPNQRFGFQGGCEEIKSHSFFQGVHWDEVVAIARPPILPPPMVFKEKPLVNVDQMIPMQLQDSLKDFLHTTSKQILHSKKQRSHCKVVCVKENFDSFF